MIARSGRAPAAAPAWLPFDVARTEKHRPFGTNGLGFYEEGEAASRRSTAVMTVGSSGGQGNLGREMRRLTMPCSCCQISCAVKKASGAPGSACLDMHRVRGDPGPGCKCGGQRREGRRTGGDSLWSAGKTRACRDAAPTRSTRAIMRTYSAMLRSTAACRAATRRKRSVACSAAFASARATLASRTIWRASTSATTEAIAVTTANTSLIIASTPGHRSRYALMKCQ
jgi:hypothetical protein